ncbi:class I SAM-dependent methyltransferase [Campylobacter ureolyticus]|uniref:class I SAM-dependent methyltransferase n=1 Tax=Campylobacter ureolyticus TaxID=827 RepID=UPI0022B30B93|nr:class I SAM-dependent methyltransferase [Campylobacter ureolyticus]MCZ6155992.1 class I SAM-dependent methyltransferase [Campylobacter ureolyticus]
MQDVKKSYDDVPYMSKVYKESLPENSYLAGLLYGLKMSEIGSARVLELACSMGGNIIPFALNHKNAKVVGVDISSIHIQKAKNLANELNITNIEFYEKNILDIDKSFGEFDYIIAHGVYSWVSDDIKDKILQIFDECLAPNGVAYLSYNTYPGWKGKEILRDIMLYRMEDKEQNNPDLKLELGFDTLAFLKNNSVPGIAKTAIDEYYDDLKLRSKSYILHEYFEETNRPNYFYEVVNSAKKHNLEFLSEANFKNSVFPPIADELKKALNNECKGDRVRFEQFIDFITDGVFRRSLFVKNEFSKKIDTNFNIKFKDLDRLFVSGNFKYDMDKELYVNLKSGAFMPKNMFELFEELSAIYPSNLNVAEFMKEYRKTHSVDDVSSFYLNLAYLIISKELAFSFEKVTFDKSIKEKPKLNTIFLKLLDFTKTNGHTTGFFNKFYDNIEINKDVDYDFLPLFDGKKDENDLVNELIKLENSGKFKFILEGSLVNSKKMVNLMAKRYTKEKIDTLFNIGILE